MSSHSVSTVLRTRGLSTSERVVLWAFADVSDDAGYSWRAIGTVADLAELDERHVRRIVGELRQRFLLDQTYQGGGRGRPALYRVLPLTLIDDPDARSRAAYEERFRLATEKGGNMSPFRMSPDQAKGGRTRAETLAQPRGKGGRVDPPTSYELDRKGDAEPRRDLGVAGGNVGDLTEAADLIPREDGESMDDYLRRTLALRLAAAEPTPDEEGEQAKLEDVEA